MTAVQRSLSLSISVESRLPEASMMRLLPRVAPPMVLPVMLAGSFCPVISIVLLAVLLVPPSPSVRTISRVRSLMSVRVSELLA